MSEDTQIQKSLVEQIIEEMFSSIEGNGSFDPQTIQLLKELAQKGDLSKVTQVAAAIKAQLGGKK